jgi:hypothetical protein
MTKEDSTNKSPVKKQRHGCLTTWLIFIIVVSTAASIFTMVADDNILGGDYPRTLMVLLGLLNIGSCILLLNWKKIGYWGSVLSSVSAFVINLSLGESVASSVVGFGGLIILTAVLFIKTDDISGWDNLE